MTLSTEKRTLLTVITDNTTVTGPVPSVLIDESADGRSSNDCAFTLKAASKTMARVLTLTFMISPADAPVGGRSDGRDSSRAGQLTIERSGYCGRTLAGVMPNMLLKVREKCAESAKPPL